MAIQQVSANHQRPSLLSAGEIVSSQPSAKLQQWQELVRKRNEYLTSQRPTAEELKSLHWIFTSQVELIDFNNFREVLESDLYTLDRPDGEEKQEKLSEAIKPLIERGMKGEMAPMDFLSQARQMFKAICLTDTEIELNPTIRGELRSYGSRRINGGEWERVYASHTMVPDNEDLIMFQMMSGFPPRAYYGLSVGLPELYQALCDKYDHLALSATDFEGRVTAEAFLQILGTRVLHPFWDANGRTFMGHLAVTLGREGIQLSDYAQAKALTGRLAKINDSFLRKVLEQGELGFIQNDNHIQIVLMHDWRQEYMNRLRRVLQQAVEQGVDKQGPFSDFISEAAWQIKMYLYRWKIFAANPIQTEEIKLQIEAKATNINKVPPPYREYFLNKFREAYLYREMTGIIIDHNFHFLIEAEADEKCMRHWPN